MREKFLYEYAVIRIVPQVEREEFANAGVVLYCAKQKFLQMLFHLDENRLLAFSPSINIPEIHEYLCAFQRICSGDESGSDIARLPIAERFRWLTAARSTIVQTSRVHPGFCEDAGEMLARLYNQLVLLP
ncbi:MAG TPA: DUF3037 domain-containing protein [Chitinophagaceae bacterium]|nr:DUF3037 domain-containing protein [Chitinophagaceae bacterium]